VRASAVGSARAPISSAVLGPMANRPALRWLPHRAVSWSPVLAASRYLWGRSHGQRRWLCRGHLGQRLRRRGPALVGGAIVACSTRIQDPPKVPCQKGGQDPPRRAAAWVGADEPDNPEHTEHREPEWLTFRVVMHVKAAGGRSAPQALGRYRSGQLSRRWCSSGDQTSSAMHVPPLYLNVPPL